MIKHPAQVVNCALAKSVGSFDPTVIFRISNEQALGPQDRINRKGHKEGTESTENL
jgi:hypothetical protein